MDQDGSIASAARYIASWHQIDESIVHHDCIRVLYRDRQLINWEPEVRSCIISLTIFCWLVPADHATNRQYEPISNERQRCTKPCSFHLITLIYEHVGINHEVSSEWGALTRTTTHYVNTCVRCLCWGSLKWDDTLTTLPLQSLLTEAPHVEIEDVEVCRIWLQVIDTVLILVAIAWSDCHYRRVQVLMLRTRTRPLLGLLGVNTFRRCLTSVLISNIHWSSQVIFHLVHLLILILGWLSNSRAWYNCILLSVNMGSWWSNFCLDELKVLAKNFFSKSFNVYRLPHSLVYTIRRFFHFFIFCNQILLKSIHFAAIFLNCYKLVIWFRSLNFVKDFENFFVLVLHVD